MKKIVAVVLMLCLMPAVALATEPTPEEILAEQWMLAADPDAADAINIYPYPSKESDGAWVFCAMDWEDAYFVGECWYLTGDEAYSLGRSRQFWDWELLNTVPEVFCSSIGRPEKRRAHASVLVDGKPFELKGADKFDSLGECRGSMYGWVDGFDYAFLCVDNNELCEVEAVEITMEQFMAFGGAQEILDTVTEHMPDAGIVSVLYRSSGVITLNLEDDREGLRHLYVWITEDGLWTYVDDWHGGLLDCHDGEGSATRHTGLRVIQSDLPE